MSSNYTYCYKGIHGIEFMSDQIMMISSYLRSLSKSSHYGMLRCTQSNALFQRSSIAKYEFKKRSVGKFSKVDKPQYPSLKK